MPTITTSSGKQFLSEHQESILDAALRSNIVLEHSCKTGRCGSCKALVLSGSTTDLYDEAALDANERESGWILTCARSATTDLILAVEELRDIQSFPVKTLPCKIQSLEKLSSDVLRVTLRLPPDLRLNYYPGQYVDVIGKGGVHRSYSMANAPTVDKLIELHIRHVPDGVMSRYWFEQAKLNDLLCIRGPLGTFCLHNVADADVIFLATGTGIAPIKAILEGLAAGPTTSLPRSIRIYWGGRIPQDLYWDPLKTGLQLEYIPVLSRANASWLGARGHVQQAVLLNSPNLEQTVVYACGSLAMIDSARVQLCAAGLDKRRFFSDAFVSSSESLKKNQ